jgi:hypothetical protein
MVSKETVSAHNWISILTGLVGVLVIGGFIWMHFDQQSSSDSVNSLSTDLDVIDSKLPIITVLPDASPLDCVRRVQTTMGSDVWISKNDKPDGSACEDGCLASSPARTCIDGVCTGTCAGICPTTIFGFDPACPEIFVSDAVVTGPAIYFQVCVDGLCTYWVIFDSLYFIEFSGPNFADWSSHGPGLVEYAGEKLCPAFIDNLDGSKACLQSSFTSLNNLHLGFSYPFYGVCAYAFECGTASAYAGQGTQLGSMSVKSTSNKFKGKGVASKLSLHEHGIDTALVAAAEQLNATKAAGLITPAGVRSRSFGRAPN